MAALAACLENPLVVELNKLNFDLHRASGLWLWAVLLIFAWSSVYMNLWDTVYTWTTRAVFEYKTPWIELSKLDKPLVEPRLGWHEAEASAQQWIREQGAQQDFSVEFSMPIPVSSGWCCYLPGNTAAIPSPPG